ELVAKAQPDGYTLLLGQQSSIAAAVTNPSLRYDPLADFAPIGRLANVPVFVVVNAAVPAKTIPELVSYGRSHPGRLTVVSYGDSTASGLAFQRLMEDTGIDLVEIYYSASAVAKSDLLAGR